jgi:inhibitor of cysteine peptidase
MIKKGFIVFCLVLIVPALVLSCAPSAQGGTSIIVTYDQFSKQNNIVQDVSVSNGKTITVQLTSNRTTGFAWTENAQISDPTIVSQSGYNWVPPSDTGGKVGVAGDEVWTFKALQPGSSTIYEEYSQPWPGGQKAAWTFKLNVTVK